MEKIRQTNKFWKLSDEGISELQGMVDDDEFLTKLERAKKDPDTKEAREILHRVLPLLSFVNKRQWGSTGASAHAYSQLLNLQRDVATAPIFLTLNPVIHNFVFANRLCRPIRNNWDQPEPVVEEVSKRKALLCENPVASGYFYTLLVHAVMKFLVGCPISDDSTTTRMPATFGPQAEDSMERRRLLGSSLAAFWAHEVSRNGFQHLHALVWVAQLSVRLMRAVAHDKALNEQFGRFCDTVACSSLPEKAWTKFGAMEWVSALHRSVDAVPVPSQVASSTVTTKPQPAQGPREREQERRSPEKEKETTEMEVDAGDRTDDRKQRQQGDVEMEDDGAGQKEYCVGEGGKAKEGEPGASSKPQQQRQQQKVQQFSTSELTFDEMCQYLAVKLEDHAKHNFTCFKKTGAKFCRLRAYWICFNAPTQIVQIELHESETKPSEDSEGRDSEKKDEEKKKKKLFTTMLNAVRPPPTEPYVPGMPSSDTKILVVQTKREATSDMKVPFRATVLQHDQQAGETIDIDQEGGRSSCGNARLISHNSHILNVAGHNCVEFTDSHNQSVIVYLPKYLINQMVNHWIYIGLFKDSVKGKEYLTVWDFEIEK